MAAKAKTAVVTPVVVAGKAARGKKQKITVVGSVITCEYPELGPEFTLVQDVNELEESVQFCMKMHGGKQVYGDSESGGTSMEKYEMCKRRMAAHRNGSWKLDSREENLEIVIEAAARLTGQSVEDVLAELEEKYESEERIEERLKELRSGQRFITAIAEIRAERAKATLLKSPPPPVTL